MNEQKALQLATEYARQYNWNCDIIWHAGVIQGYHFVWLKNTSLARYTGFGHALRISPNGEITEIESNIEIHEIAKDAIKKHEGK